MAMVVVVGMTMLVVSGNEVLLWLHQQVSPVLQGLVESAESTSSDQCLLEQTSACCTYTHVQYHALPAKKAQRFLFVQWLECGCFEVPAVHAQGSTTPLIECPRD